MVAEAGHEVALVRRESRGGGVLSSRARSSLRGGPLMGAPVNLSSRVPLTAPSLAEVVGLCDQSDASVVLVRVWV